MRIACLPLFLTLLVATGCGDDMGRNAGAGSTTPRYERPQGDPSLLGQAVVPVRVGELGPNFAACNARGRLRERAADRPVPVRAAPFEPARQVAQLPLGADFFICTRTLDQRWLGIVFDAAGRASRSCGVSAPLPRRQDYEGPCESGWVASAQVQLAGAVDALDLPEQVVPAVGEASGNSAEPN